jgi:predicted dithiol-disulfide oxidoreductase (DUF899 family)
LALVAASAITPVNEARQSAERNPIGGGAHGTAAASARNVDPRRSPIASERDWSRLTPRDRADVFRQPEERSVQMNLPNLVSAEEWEAANKRILSKEKELTRASDALAAERRRQPIMRVEKKYEFAGPNGKATLLDLFEGRPQLFVYNFMFGPNQDVGCDGCSMVVDQLAHLSHLHARSTSFALASRAPIEKLERYRKRMGWNVPWYSWGGGTYGVDLGLSPAEPKAGEYQDGEMFGLNAFFRDGDNIYRTYFTSWRGLEVIGPVWSYLDRSLLGRQETWEKSPEGWPQTAPYKWWRRHDEYDQKR